MLEVKVTVESSALTVAINNLAKALQGQSRSTPCKCAEENPEPVEVVPEPEKEVASETTFTQAVVNAVSYEPETSTTSERIKAPALQTYTRDDIMRAAADVVDKGKMQDVQKAIQKYGVQVITMLPEERLQDFARDLMALGATF